MAPLAAVFVSLPFSVDNPGFRLLAKAHAKGAGKIAILSWRSEPETP
jgi:hypothetical protein